MELPLPRQQCPFCLELLAKYSKMTGYTKYDLQGMLPYYAPRKSWISKSPKGGSQMLIHYFQCRMCFPMTNKGWKWIDKRYGQKELDVREIGK